MVTNYCPMYNLHGTWYRVTLNLVESIPRPVIQPPQWRYIDPEHLEPIFIHSNEDLNKLRSHIIEPAEKLAIIDTLARGVNGRHILSGKNLFI